VILIPAPSSKTIKSAPTKNIFVKHFEYAPRKEIIRTFAAAFQNDYFYD